MFAFECSFECSFELGLVRGSSGFLDLIVSYTDNLSTGHRRRNFHTTRTWPYQTLTMFSTVCPTMRMLLFLNNWSLVSYCLIPKYSMSEK